MIRLGDASLLAATKLKTHRVRLAIAVIVSALLLALLAVGLNTSAGFFEGMQRFSAEGLNNRHLVSISVSPSGQGLTDPSEETIKRATELRSQTIADKTAKAKKIGVTYDPKLEPSVMSPYSTDDYPMLNYDSEAVRRALMEPYEKTPFVYGDIESIAQKYSATDIHTLQRFHPIKEPVLAEMPDGKERFDEEGSPGIGADSFPPEVAVLPSSLTKPFQTVASPSKIPSAVPVVVPYSYVEKALGFKKLPANTAPAQKLARIKEVREKAGDIYPIGCYRNSESLERIKSALTQIKADKANKDTPGYEKPALVYGLPATDSCGAPTVVRDVRTATEKLEEQKLRETNSSTVSATPEQRKITFRVVGIVPDDMRFSGELTTLQSLATMIASSHLNNMWVVPEDAARAMGFAITSPQSKDAADNTAFMLEFATADAAKKFADEIRCPIANCETPKREITVTQFGSNSIFVAQARQAVSQILLIAGAIVVAISSVILMAIIGRMIADGRRETAVFRAIGAKRSDIALIYAIYTFIVALLIGCVGVAMGAGIAAVINQQYGAEVTAQALLAFGSSDITRVFPLSIILIHNVLLVIGLALAAGLIGMIVPLLRNVRRSPIGDMRDE